MSTIQDVRTAEKKVNEILQEFKKLDPNDQRDLAQQLLHATDEYAKAVRELK